jgi:AcrR family transcriptional regulator
MASGESSPTRRYTSSLRAEQAAQTRAKVLDAARELFSERGYTATTMPEIARRAGVSTETVQTHGPKVALLKAALDAFSFGGTQGTDARDTDLGRQLLAVGSAAEAATMTAQVLAHVNAETQGLWLAFSEAARGDADVAAQFRAYVAGVRAQNEILVREWAERGYLRMDVPSGELVDRAMLIGSVELYDRAVRLGGASPDEYVRTVAALFLTALTPA